MVQLSTYLERNCLDVSLVAIQFECLLVWVFFFLDFVDLAPQMPALLPYKVEGCCLEKLVWYRSKICRALLGLYKLLPNCSSKEKKIFIFQVLNLKGRQLPGFVPSVYFIIKMNLVL